MNKLKGYRTYLACFAAVVLMLVACYLHCHKPTKTLTIGPSSITVPGVTPAATEGFDWVFWCQVAAGIMAGLASVFRALAGKDYAAALRELGRLREMLSRQKEETVDYAPAAGSAEVVKRADGSMVILTGDG